MTSLEKPWGAGGAGASLVGQGRPPCGEQAGSSLRAL